MSAFSRNKEKKKDGGRKIIGLDDDSDAENDSKTAKKPGKRAKNEENELKNEIIELEKTFENLDLDNSIGGANVKKPFTRGLYRSSTIDQNYSFDQRPQHTNSRPTMAFGGSFGTPAIAKPLKFSWEEQTVPIVVDKNNDDWNYQQVSYMDFMLLYNPQKIVLKNVQLWRFTQHRGLRQF